MDEKKPKYQGKAQLDEKLEELLNANVNTRVNGKAASGKTMKTRSEALHTCFNDSWKLGFRILNPANLETKHIAALCEHWYEKGIANKTMQTRLSTLRIMSAWIGKPKLVKSVAHYLPDVPKKDLRVVTCAERSKSWAENGIDLIDKFRQADDLDERFAVMLRLELAFGLRRDEVIQFKPNKSDFGSLIKVFEAKNGRKREIAVRTEAQRMVLNMAKEICVGKLEHMGWKHTKSGRIASLEYNEQRYNHCMAAIGITKEAAGVTGHGLRAHNIANDVLISHRGAAGWLDFDNFHDCQTLNNANERV